MLCPKCSYISFDHLTSCPKCDNDLTVISAELKGTSAKVEQHSFLNAVLREPVAHDETLAVEEEASALEDSGENVDETAEPSVPTIGDDLERDTPDAFDESDVSELTVDLGEMAPLDLGDIEDGDESDALVENGTLGETVDDDSEEFGLDISDIDAAGGADVPEIELPDAEGEVELNLGGEEISAGETLANDPDSLSLDLDDIVVDNSTESEDELTIDFDQIDLSDLVDSSDKGAVQDGGEVPVAADEERDSGLPQEEIVLTLEDVDSSSAQEKGAALPPVEDSPAEEIMLELDSVDGIDAELSDASDIILDLSLEAEGADAVIDSLSDIIDLSLEDDGK